MAVRLEVGAPTSVSSSLSTDDSAEYPDGGRVVRKQRGRLGFSLVRTSLAQSGEPGIGEAEVAEERRAAAARAWAAWRVRPLALFDDQFQLGLLFPGHPVGRGA